MARERRGQALADDVGQGQRVDQLGDPCLVERSELDDDEPMRVGKRVDQIVRSRVAFLRAARQRPPTRLDRVGKHEMLKQLERCGIGAMQVVDDACAESALRVPQRARVRRLSESPPS